MHVLIKYLKYLYAIGWTHACVCEKIERMGHTQGNITQYVNETSFRPNLDISNY